MVSHFLQILTTFVWQLGMGRKMMTEVLWFVVQFGSGVTYNSPVWQVWRKKSFRIRRSILCSTGKITHNPHLLFSVTIQTVSPSKQTYLLFIPTCTANKKLKITWKKSNFHKYRKVNTVLLRKPCSWGLAQIRAQSLPTAVWALAPGQFWGHGSLSLIDLADLILVQGPAETKAIFYIRHIASHFTTQWKDMESQDKQHLAPRLPNVLIWAHSSHISKLYWVKNHFGRHVSERAQGQLPIFCSEHGQPSCTQVDQINLGEIHRHVSLGLYFIFTSYLQNSIWDIIS